MRKLLGWKVAFTNSSEGFCNHYKKTIFCGVKGNFIRLLLHEIAHIPKIRHRTHGKQFWRRFELSLRRYIGNNKLGRQEKKWKKEYINY